MENFHFLNYYLLVHLLNSLVSGSLALGALLAGLHFKKHYINV